MLPNIGYLQLNKYEANIPIKAFVLVNKKAYFIAK
jgi:hypothetical protein